MSEPQDSKDKSFKPVDRLRKKLTLDNLWLWILRLLLESNKYAYELRQEINDRFGFSPATVTSYAVLYRLERAGFVTEASASKVPNRKYYEITSQGREALKEAEKTIRRALSELF
ncbi:MAG: helix-turn-helix transcriptional regulator, partial [Candidatus Heimdallarchaeota archaeon]|nr:helix-turn-helix transcriptional regulator [Candidatus Heimdallarchaeota archaeon]